MLLLRVKYLKFICGAIAHVYLDADNYFKLVTRSLSATSFCHVVTASSHY
ncbi:hypothetical protein H6G41_24400 [Tolypothrix sp. FACHB-123]|nr:hypothetical protein [Tolypothrix sp. FACHB-123]MBD2357713.1 hypothetical protein [Tolypothrix sp. FACHB-123]